MDAQLIANNPQEEALIKIRSLQTQNITTAQRQRIGHLEDRISKLFLRLVYNQYRINKKQLFSLGDQEIGCLFNIVYSSVKRRAIVSGILIWTFILIPITGWMVPVFMYEEGYPLSCCFWIDCIKLRKILGDKFFSAKRLRELNP